MIRLRIGLRTNKANPTTTKSIKAVTTNTMCQLPVVLMMLATGTRQVPARIFKILCGFFRPEFSYIFFLQG